MNLLATYCHEHEQWECSWITFPDSYPVVNAVGCHAPAIGPVHGEHGETAEPWCPVHRPAPALTLDSTPDPASAGRHRR